MLIPDDGPSSYVSNFMNSINDENTVNNKISSLIKKLSPTKSSQKRFVRHPAVTKDKDNAVKNHHLFIDPFGSNPRNKTFKNQLTDNYGVHTQIKQQPYIEEIRKERASNFGVLLTLSSNLPGESCAKTFYELMLFNLSKGYSLEILFPPDFSFEAPEELKKLYNQVLTLNLDDIKNIMNFEPLVLIFDAFKVLEERYNKVKSQLNKELVKGYCDLEKNLQNLDIKNNDHLSFVNEVADIISHCKNIQEKKSQDYNFFEYMDSFSTTVHLLLSDPLKMKEDLKIVSEFIERFWIKDFSVTNMTAKVSANRNTDIKQSLKNCFDRIKNYNDKTKIFNLILRVNLKDPELFNVQPKQNVGNPELNKLLKCVLEILYFKYNLLRCDHKEKLQLLKSDLKTYVLDSNNLKFFIDQKERFLPKDPSLIKTLTNEYKQHSLARFDHLFNHFTAFTNVVDALGNLGNTRYPDFKVHFRQIISHLIENSTIENTAQSKDKTLEIKKTIISDLHRETMGKEEKPKTDAESSLIRTQLNLILNSQDFIVEVDRSHTLPFPILFAWDPKKIIEKIDERFAEKTENEYSLSKESYFNKDYFEQIKERNLPHRDIVKMFHEIFEENLIRGYTEKQLLFKSLEMVKDFFLKLFSETELLPEFMNKSIDAVSEWKLTTNHTYKIALANGLNELIKMEGEIKESDTVVKLLPYLAETIVKLETFYKAEKLKLRTPASAWNLVCLGLVKEAVMKSVEAVGYKEAIDSFNKDKQAGYNQLIHKIARNNFDKQMLPLMMINNRNKLISESHDEIMIKMCTPIKV